MEKFGGNKTRKERVEGKGVAGINDVRGVKERIGSYPLKRIVTG